MVSDVVGAAVGAQNRSYSSVYFIIYVISNRFIFIKYFRLLFLFSFIFINVIIYITFILCTFIFIHYIVISINLFIPYLLHLLFYYILLFASVRKHLQLKKYINIDYHHLKLMNIHHSQLFLYILFSKNI